MSKTTAETIYNASCDICGRVVYSTLAPVATYQARRDLASHKRREHPNEGGAAPQRDPADS